jgi:hypothetical protein
MKHRWNPFGSGAVAVSLATTAAFAALVALGLAWDAWQRSADVPAALRYVPADATGVAVIEPIQQLWPAAVAHLGYKFAAVDCKAKPPANPLANLVHELKCSLRDEGVDSENPEQVRSHGLDTARPIVIAVRGRLDSDVPFVAAVPVLDQARFQATLGKLFSSPPKLVSDPLHAPDDTCPRGAKPLLCISFPSPDLALVYNDRALAAAALADPAANLAALRAYDGLAEGRRTVDASAGADTPWMWAHIRQVGLPLTGPATFMLKADQDRIGLAVQFEFDTLGSSLLHRLAEPAAALRGGADGSWIATALTLRLQDDDLAGYLAFLYDMAPETAQQIDEDLKPYDMVPKILRSSGVVPRVEAHITRLRNGIPEASNGAAMSRDHADAAVLRFQNQRRSNHDRALLDAAAQCRTGVIPAPASTEPPPNPCPASDRNAADQCREGVPSAATPTDAAPPPAPDCPPSDRDAAGQCREGVPPAATSTGPPPARDCPTPDVDAARLQAAGNEPAYGAADFVTSDYCGCVGWESDQHPHVLHKGCGSEHGAICPAGATRYSYLLPPVIDDDFRYDLIPDNQDIDRQALKADQYRPVTAFGDAAGVLWIALDLDTLMPTLDAARSHQSAEPDPVLGRWPSRAKLRLTLDPGWVLAQALLSPTQKHRDFGTEWRDDLRRYRSAAVTFGPSGRPNGLLVTVHLGRE